MGFCQAWALYTDDCDGIGEHQGSEPPPVGSKKEKITARCSMTTEKACGFFSWYMQQCSTVSAIEEVMMQSRVSGWHIWWRTSLCIGVSWYYLTGRSEQPRHGSGERGRGSKLFCPSEQQQAILFRQHATSLFKLQQADRLLAHGTVVSDTCTLLLAYRIRGLTE